MNKKFTKRRENWLKILGKGIVGKIREDRPLVKWL